MTADRSLTPDDAVVAIRSFPRRFRAVLALPDEDRGDPDEIARRVGPDGHSAAEHLIAAEGVLSLLEQAISQSRQEDEAVLHPAFADLSSASPDAAADDDAPVPDLLDRFEGSAAHTADRVDGVPTDDWGRRVQVAGDASERTLLSVTQDAVSTVAERLRAAQRTIEAVL